VKNMKKYYEEPDFNTVMFTVKDVIMTSGGGNNAMEDYDVSDDATGENNNWKDSTLGW
jgi:hypothetical protein